MKEILQYPIYGGTLAGLGWQWVNIAYLVGGLFLLWQKTIRWHIPLSFLLSLTLCATLGWLFSPQSFAAPQIHLLSGATMLGAFFILTDPVTASTTNRGRLIFGASRVCWCGSSAALAVILTVWLLPCCWRTLPFR